MQGNCMIVQSGGPTAVINNSLIGIIDGISRTPFNGEVYGSVGGIHGLLHEEFVSLKNLSISDRNRLRWTPGAALGTWRYKLSKGDIEEIVRILIKNDIRYFFYIGGNGSMSVAKAIHECVVDAGYNLIVIGVPKSIDNDVVGTDHSPGYGSTAKFLATSVIDVDMDMGSYPESNGVTIIETMGRNSGWLAGACSLSEDYLTGNSQLLIYIPEVAFDFAGCLDKLEKAHHEKRNTILVVAEGIRKKNGELLNRNTEYDFLGRPKLGGVSSHLKDIIKNETGIKTRYMTLSVWQRSSMTLASKTDVEEAYHLGIHAVRLANLNHTGIMVSLKRDLHDEDYHISYETIQLNEVAGKERFIPKEWYNTKENSMTMDFKDYAFPMIKGEIVLPMENGLPIYQRVI
ncbi:diphosphate--fructose-6-phosphate 1-phosphotransferase [Oceanobacillus sp. Castelsardo]|uniref:diphosphate--fructose-6-phosphate 1-phosphotransferase n=1 Tax=Oceanobacillus sp. Castelsardo TaxID=1851204 RepID=UPI000838DBEE|nr:diphosphate--fructose-6-phosphate 1-phosphotransferase [Oceanobacillus sp. Castelsardo]